jgi:hypothetical protein
MTLLNTASAVRLGSNTVSRVYAGATIVWPTVIPKQVPGLLWWLDASKLVGANGAAIASWSDLSGNNHNCGTAGLTPPAISSAVNGLTVARFTGSQSMQVAGLGTEMSGRNQWSVMLMLYPTTYSNYPIVLTSPTTKAWDWVLEYDTNCQFYVGSQNGHYRCFIPPSPPAVPAWTMFSITAQSSGTRLWLNQSEITNYRPGGSGDLTFPIPDLGIDAILGAYYDKQFGYGGNVAELLAYDHALTDTERQKLESYLQGKWV